MSDVIITGADGFIGSHLVRYLSEKEYNIYALISPNCKNRNRIENVKNVHIIECNIIDYNDIIPNLPVNAQAFLHFAWSGVSPESRNSYDDQIKNIEICMSAVRIAAAIKAKKFIFPGSTLEYSYSNHIINSEALPSPQNAYGATKVACRYLCEAMCKDLGIDYIYVVISGIYSEDRIDNNVIYYTISSLLRKEKPKLTKLEQLWDYVHIDDVVSALQLVIEYGKNGRFYSIGHGDNWPLYNYIYKIRNIIDPNLELGIGEIPYNNNQMPMSCVDLTSICDDTGFKPCISFDEGINRVIKKVKETII